MRLHVLNFVLLLHVLFTKNSTLTYQINEFFFYETLFFFEIILIDRVIKVVCIIVK